MCPGSKEDHEVTKKVGEYPIRSEFMQADKNGSVNGQLLRRRQVEQLVQLSRSSIYAAVKAGTFPRPVRIGERAVAWLAVDIEEWIATRPASSCGGSD